MGHANLFGLYDWQSPPRGNHAFASVNWAMGMVSVRAGRFETTARAMLSAEPATVGDGGYPLLLQTGETWQGQALADRQHPHDLVMELAVLQRVVVSDDVGFHLYIAPAGEPALGPAAFPHRASAFVDPIAPLSHHWQDATHISFGVLTAGVFTRWGQLEGSWFNGREPDETRTDIEFRVPDSYAARVTVNPSSATSAQVSYGWLRSPEALDPDEDESRLTASVSLHRPTPGNGSWTSTAAWGWNVGEGHSALMESTLDLDEVWVVYGRAEFVQKEGDALGVPGGPYNVGALGIGTAVYIEPIADWKTGLGIRGNFAAVPAGLAAEYGSAFPAGFVVYLNVRPARMLSMAEMHH